MLRAKAGSEVLCVHKDATNEFGRLPLLVTRTFGAGKVLFMGTDGAWRWRKGVEDKYHYRFWGQVVRWMAYQRNMAKGETMRLYYVPDQPQDEPDPGAPRQRHGPRRRAAAQGRRLGADHGPVGQGRAGRISLRAATSGACSPADSTPQEPGRHKVTLSCKQTGATLETTFFVQGVAAERLGPAGAAGSAGRDRPRDAAARSSRPASSTRSCSRWPSFPTPRPRSAGSRSGAIP